MGCGCKNKSNSSQSPTTQTTTQNQNQASKPNYVQETVKDAIKKTVEKYYRKNS